MRLITLLILFASVATATYSIGALLTLEFSMWRWPASAQVAAVLVSTIGTVLLYALFGFGRVSQPWEPFDHFEEDRR